MILDAFKDIVKHTHSLGFIEMVKVVGTSTDVKLEAIDPDKTVIMYATMKNAIPGIESTVGMSRMSQLKGFMDLHKDSAVSIVTEQRNGVDIPCEIKFDAGRGDVAYYRFMSETASNEHIKVPAFKGATWNVSVKPEKSKIGRLSAIQGILGGFEKRFSVSVSNGNLMFSVGAGPTERTSIPFSEDVQGNLKFAWSWPLTQVLNILKLNDNESVTMHFSDMGALKIDVESSIGDYSYILPAART